MIKIFLTVRNRLSVTKKCIESIEKHTNNQYTLYVYNNLSDYLIDDHFDYFKELYKQNRISQIVFNTSKSTFNAFSKAVACNQFGQLHEMDPNRDKTNFLLFLDNDIILTKGWDKLVLDAWNDVSKNKMKNIKVITQLPGGIVSKEKSNVNIANCMAKVGKNGGSGLWTVKPNFFSDVGYLDINKLVGSNKKHDQHYWKLMEEKTGGKPYILGIKTKLGYHSGPVAGSVCNKLEGNKKEKNVDISFPNQEKKIDDMSFNEFFDMISKDKKLDKY